MQFADHKLVDFQPRDPGAAYRHATDCETADRKRANCDGT
jgi:hypothetical protein